MSERELYYTYCTDCWLETGVETLCIPFYYTVNEVIFLPCFLISLVSCLSSFLFRQGWGAATSQTESFQFKCKTRAMFFHLLFGPPASPAVSHLQQVSTPHRLRDDRA